MKNRFDLANRGKATISTDLQIFVVIKGMVECKRHKRRVWMLVTRLARNFLEIFFTHDQDMSFLRPQIFLNLMIGPTPQVVWLQRKKFKHQDVPKMIKVTFGAIAPP